MPEVTLKIEGMSCGHCVINVKKAVDAIDGVSSSDVAVGSARVVYDESQTNRNSIAEAVRKAGYKVIE